MFCGETRRTVEHLIPEWLSKLIAREFGNGDPIDVTYRFTDRSGDVTERSYGSMRAQVKVRQVCQRCNGGWMSRMESAAKPIMTPMVTGQRTRLELEQQVVLSHWAAKTVVMIQQFESSAVVFGEGDIAEVANGSAPRGFHIRLGFRPEFREPIDILVSSAHVISVAEAAAARSAGQSLRVGEPNNFLATFAFGGLAVAVAGGPGIRRDERWVTGGEQPLMIWPPSPSGISWPPVQPLIKTKAELHAFHQAIYACVENPELDARVFAADEPHHDQVRTHRDLGS